MADYKVVDAEQLEFDLTRVANTIREQAGLSDKLAFPNKWIEVLANMGGGLPAGIAKLECGEIVLTANKSITQANPFEIAHNLGEAPDFFFMVCFDNSVHYTDSSTLLSLYCYLISRVNGEPSDGAVDRELNSYYGAGSNTYGNQRWTNPAPNTNLTSTVAKLTPRYPADAYGLYIKKGRTYHWVAVKFA